MQKNTRKKRKLIFLFAIKRRTHGSGSIINSTSPDYKRLRRSCLLQSPNFDGIQGNWCRKELKGRLTRISRIANFLVSFDVAHSCGSEVPWFSFATKGTSGLINAMEWKLIRTRPLKASPCVCESPETDHICGKFRGPMTDRGKPGRGDCVRLINRFALINNRLR